MLSRVALNFRFVPINEPSGIENYAFCPNISIKKFGMVLLDLGGEIPISILKLIFEFH